MTSATRSNLGFEMTDLAAIVPLGNMPVVMVVNPAKGYKTLTDFVAAARAKPGTVNYASAGAGNSCHLNGEWFRLAAGFEAVHLPFKGAPEALTEVVAGRADFYFAPLINALPSLKDGQLQALAANGSARASALPDVPTTVEAGYPNSEYNFWAGASSRRQRLRPTSVAVSMWKSRPRSSTRRSARDSRTSEPIRCL